MRCSRRLADRSPIPEAAKSKARHGRLGRHGVFNFRAEGSSSERAHQNCWNWHSWRPWQRSCWTSAVRQPCCAGWSCSKAEAKTKALALANLAAAAVIFKPPDPHQTFPRLKRLWKTTISAILPSKTPWGIRTQCSGRRTALGEADHTQTVVAADEAEQGREAAGRAAEPWEGAPGAAAQQPFCKFVIFLNID